MWHKRDHEKGIAILAVLAAAAREAEELLASEEDLEEQTVAEANRRLELFMRMARDLAS